MIRSSRTIRALPAVVACLLAACGSDDDKSVPEPSPVTSSSPSASPACVPFAGPPDGSAQHPYLKRSMALDCREDVKRVQTALGLPASGHFDNATATAVIAKQKPYACIQANDGQVGEQTWALIVDGVEPCKPGQATAPAKPAFANCNLGTPRQPLEVAEWALQTADGTVLRRCGDNLELLRDRRTSIGAVQDLGSSACAQFEESFGTDAERTEICVSDPGAIDRLQADDAGGGEAPVWQDDITARYVPD